MSSKDEQKKIPVSMSPAFLAPIEEKDHYGLFRSIVVKKPEGDEYVEPPLGPLMVFRKCSADEKEDMWTFDVVTKQRIGLKKIWDARKTDENK